MVSNVLRQKDRQGHDQHEHLRTKCSCWVSWLGWWKWWGWSIPLGVEAMMCEEWLKDQGMIKPIGGTFERTWLLSNTAWLARGRSWGSQQAEVGSGESQIGPRGMASSCGELLPSVGATWRGTSGPLLGWSPVEKLWEGFFSDHRSGWMRSPPRSLPTLRFYTSHLCNPFLVLAEKGRMSCLLWLSLLAPFLSFIINCYLLRAIMGSPVICAIQRKTRSMSLIDPRIRNYPSRFCPRKVLN